MSVTTAELAQLLTVKQLKSALDLYDIGSEQKAKKEELQVLIQSKRVDAGVVVRHLFTDSADRASFLKKVDNLRKKKNSEEKPKRVRGAKSEAKEAKSGKAESKSGDAKPKRGRKPAKKKEESDEEFVVNVNVTQNGHAEHSEHSEHSDEDDQVADRSDEE